MTRCAKDPLSLDRVAPEILERVAPFLARGSVPLSSCAETGGDRCQVQHEVDLVSVFSTFMTEPVPDLREFHATLPAAVGRAVARALERDRKNASREWKTSLWRSTQADLSGWVCFDKSWSQTYTVHMKSVTPTDARKNWFRLLDEVAAGEVVHIRRGGKLIVLRCEDHELESETDYSGLIGGSSVSKADQWSWDWDDEGLRAIP